LPNMSSGIINLSVFDAQQLQRINSKNRIRFFCSQVALIPI
jgi:hypothetical protein